MSGNYGNNSQQQQQHYAPPPGPPPPRQTRDEEYAPPSGPPPGRQGNNDEYAPPAGPPPGQYAPPTGPPTSHQNQNSDYAPPPGPPPRDQPPGYYASPSGPPPTQQQNTEYAPPPGPPPSKDWIAPPQDNKQAQDTKQANPHDWESVVPDTTLFPPPPAIFSGYEYSPGNNATEEEAEAGEMWCEQHPLTQPMALDPAGQNALQTNNFRLVEPPGFNGSLRWLGAGHWEGRTNRACPDRCLISYPPLYVVAQHDPTRYGQPKTIYYEVKLRGDSKTVNLSLGFSALPYPSFRLPGWHRGSLAVHGDDGHRYINDRWGGKDFTVEFRKGDTYGIGMTFTPDGSHRPRVDIFFTRNGSREGGWDLHEETDAEEDLPVTGLEGFHDLCCSVGAYEDTSFEVVFDPAKWLCKEVK